MRIGADAHHGAALFIYADEEGNISGRLVRMNGFDHSRGGFDCEKEEREREERMQKLVAVSRNGQYSFRFMKEARTIERAAV